MAHSRRTGKTIECALLVAVALAACSSASAKKSDRSQLIQVAADHQQATMGSNGKVILIGHVKISQGTLLIEGAKAIGYENNENEWDHAIVTGSPARFQQQLDNGSMVHGSADTIEYMVAENTVILTGSAMVVQQGRGEFHGAKLTYHTDSGQIVGEGGAGGQVHMTFQPKSPAAKNASTGAPASPGTTVAPPVPSASTGAAAPATTGIH
ncbi:MAG TPA: lipopolysaccharide transport periplasmic protein LptA [Rhodanobacteraceae bacterium]|nr:lipopolysaccharide transport periplasmic protein LptA [Rhodanobacteraceae bacterium]